MIDGFEAYEIYTAVRAAYTSEYDYFKYHGKMKLSQESFLSNKNKWLFVGLGRKFDSALDLQGYVAYAHMVKDHGKCWITNIVKDSTTLAEYKASLSNRMVKFENVLYTYESLDKILEEGYPDGKHLPKPFEKWLATNDYKQLNYLILIDSVYEMFHFWNEEHKGNFVWDDFYKKVQVYKKFYAMQNYVDKKIVKEIIQKHFTLTK